MRTPTFSNCTHIFLLLVSALFVNQTVAAPKNLDVKGINKQNWYEIATPHFRIISNADIEKSTQLAKELEDFRYFVTRYMGFTQRADMEPVHFLVLKDDKSHSDFGLPRSLGGIYTVRPSGFYAIANADELKFNKPEPRWGLSVNYHEMVHHFEINSTKKLFAPRWYQEGMAEYGKD
jgi:hypothetical protein